MPVLNQKCAHSGDASEKDLREESGPIENRYVHAQTLRAMFAEAERRATADIPTRPIRAGEL